MAYVLGIGVTPVGRYPDRSFSELVAEAYSAAVKDAQLAEPLTRSIAAPRGDGAGAVLVCSAEFLRQQPASVRERALKIRGHSLAGGWINAS